MEKIKKAFKYMLILSIPFGLIFIGVKYFNRRKNGEEVPVEEVVAEGVEMVRKIFSAI